MDAHLWPDSMNDQENIGAEPVVPDVHINVLPQKKVRKYIEGALRSALCTFQYMASNLDRCQLVRMLLHCLMKSG